MCAVYDIEYFTSRDFRSAKHMQSFRLGLAGSQSYGPLLD